MTQEVATADFPASRRTASPSRRLERASSVCLVCLLTLWLAQVFIAERHWITLTLTYMPQFPFAVPPALLLLLSAARRRHRAVVVNLAAVVFTVFLLLDLRVRLPRAASTPVDLRMMTFNIEHGSRTLEAVATVVRESDPDVVCFQESSVWGALEAPPQALKRLLPEYRYWLLRAGESIASKYPIVRSRVHALPHVPRGWGAVEAALDVNGRRVTVVSVHLKSYWYDTWPLRRLREMPADLRRSVAERRDQIDMLLRIVDGANGPILIAGDFNTPPRGHVYRRIIAGGMEDAFRAAGSGFAYTITAKTPIKRIDFLFTAGGATAQRVFVPAVAASDHRPVAADIALTGAGTPSRPE